MISNREAVQAATKALIDLLGGKPPDGLRVEEFYPAKDGKFRVGLSYYSYVRRHDDVLQTPVMQSWFEKANPTQRERVLSLLDIDAETGDLLGMKAGE